MKDKQGTKIMDGDLVMVWQPSYQRWIPGRVTSVNERKESADVHTGGYAHLSPSGSDMIVIEDPGMPGVAARHPKQTRTRPSFESLKPKEPCGGIVCPICPGLLRTSPDMFQHWEAGHFDMMTCECGFTYGVGSSHGHIVPPSLERMPLPAHDIAQR